MNKKQKTVDAQMPATICKTSHHADDKSFRELAEKIRNEYLLYNGNHRNDK